MHTHDRSRPRLSVAPTLARRLVDCCLAQPSWAKELDVSLLAM